MEVFGVTRSLVDYLRVHIVSGEVAPLQKLNEVELASHLEISRPPLREAFRILENDHLVVSVPRKGCYVTGVSIEDFQDIYKAREILECSSIDMLEVKGIRDLPGVALALEKTRGLSMPKGTDPFEKFNYLKAIADFHIKLVESAGNSRILYFYNSIFPSLARYQSMYVFISGLMDKSKVEHEQIMRSINRGKFDQAKKLLWSHLESFMRYVETQLRKKGKDRNLVAGPREKTLFEWGQSPDKYSKAV
jgi:DNA-binding GntR family transcriptional regulator